MDRHRSLDTVKQNLQLPSINSNTFIFKQKTAKNNTNNTNKLSTINNSLQTLTKSEFADDSYYTTNQNFNKNTKDQQRIKQSHSVQTYVKPGHNLLSIVNQRQVQLQKNKMKLNRKLAKYLPRNSSFSLLYGEKRLQVQKQSQFQQDQLNLMPKDYSQTISNSQVHSANISTLNNLHQLDMKQILKQKKQISQRKFQIHQRKNSHQANNLKKHSQNQSSAQYIKTLDILKRTSLIQSNKGKSIVKKSISKQNEIHLKYQQLQEQSIEAIHGYTNYHLEQQSSQKYREDLRQMWMRGDANRKLFK